jgi:hypothetical protein
LGWNPLVAIIRWILSLLKREHLLRTRYHTSHPHFLWYVGVDALLSITFIVGGLHYFGPVSWVSHEQFALNHSGVIPMPVDKFLDVVTRESEMVFWLGPVKTDNYAINSNIKGEYEIIYFPKGSNPAVKNGQNLTITTYLNRNVYFSAVHPLLVMDIKELVPGSHNTVEYNSITLNSEIVALKNKPEVIVITYPKAQTVQTLIKNANALKRIQ